MRDIIDEAFDELMAQLPSSPVRKRYKSSDKKAIVVIDPVTFQPIRARSPKKSDGFYRNFKRDRPFVVPFKDKESDLTDLFKKRDKSKSLEKLFKKECPEGKEYNPKTKRCVNRKCEIYEVRDKKTKKCVEKPCPKGKTLNKKTGRCVKTK